MKKRLEEFQALQTAMPILQYKLAEAQKSPESLLKWLEGARKAGMSGSDEDVIKIAKEWSPSRGDYFSGETIDGIFVEARPTLFNSAWELNEDVLLTLFKLAMANGKDIVVIADRNPWFTREKLKAHGLESWSVVYKGYLQGATLSIVVNLHGQAFPAEDKITGAVFITAS